MEITAYNINLEKEGPWMKVRYMAQMGMLAAISVVLMLFEIPLPFAPAFYEIDFS